MSTFELKSQLHKRDQIELDRILALPVAARQASDTAFLNARLQYATNKVRRYASDAAITPQNPQTEQSASDILEAEGNTLPTSYSGFAKGCIFRVLNKLGRNLYINV